MISSGTSRPPKRRAARGTPVLVLAAIVAFGGVAVVPVASADDRPPLPPSEVRAWQTGLLRPDRLEHGSLALTIGLGVGVATRRPVAAVAVPATLGLAKEIADRHGSEFDVVDLAADLLGAAAAGALTGLW